jgi:ribonuclease VapC
LILDTSAILSIFFREPERDELLTKIGEAAIVGVGAPTLAETAILLAARVGEQGPRQLGRLVERAAIVVVAFEAVHWQVAAEAWARYGKGRHPAGLNLGDCLAYATAVVAGQPLLWKGDDFSKTDIAAA